MKAELTRQGIAYVKRSRQCGVPRTVEVSIPFTHILDARQDGGYDEITYLKSSGGQGSKIATKRLKIAASADREGRSTPEAILAQAFPGPQNKKLLILINPHGGTGDAQSRYKEFAAPVFERLGVTLDVIVTTHSNHARDLIRDMVLDGYDAIVCVSGDGLPHEVINGLALRQDADKALKIPVTQLPGGSGNAMTHTLHGTDDWSVVALNIVKGAPMAMDLMRISQGDQVYYSFLSQSFGVIAWSDLGTEDWRWMGGARFIAGLFIKVMTLQRYPADIAYKEYSGGSAVPRGLESIYGSVNDPVPHDWKRLRQRKLSVFYAGNMSYMTKDGLAFPNASNSDGAMDLVQWETSVGRLKAVRLFDSMQTGRHASDPAANYTKIVAYRLTPLANTYLSIDGEKYPAEPFQVEILPQAATLLSHTGEYFY